jgi:hypothetical protein
MTENGLGRCSEAVLRARFSIEQLIEKCALGRTYLDKTQARGGASASQLCDRWLALLQRILRFLSRIPGRLRGYDVQYCSIAVWAS